MTASAPGGGASRDGLPTGARLLALEALTCRPELFLGLEPPTSEGLDQDLCGR